MKLTELQDTIDRANHAYYTTGASIMEDAKYDKLKDELQKLNPTDPRLFTVGSEIRDSILQKCNHTIPMGSLSKAKNESEYRSWVQNNLIKAGVSSSDKLFASYKADGSSISLEYSKGRLVKAVTRGDGIVGEDTTANVLNIKNIPKLVKHKKDGNLFTGFVRGEIVLLSDDWSKVDAEKSSNPRNLAGGILRRKDGAESEYLTFMAFRIFDQDGTHLGDTQSEMFEFMESYGFSVVPYFSGNKDEVFEWYKEIAKIRPSIPYWIDGITVFLEDLNKQLSLGESSNCPKGAVAIKFEAEGGESVLLSVSVTVGHGGNLCPNANFTPVIIGGTTVECASLYNYDYIEELGLCIGDKIEVIKANDIIPRVNDVIEKGKNRISIPIPIECPVCNGKVEKKSNITGLESTAIFCINKECPAQVSGKIDKFLSSINILGIGTNLIEALIKNLGVKDAADLYTLKNRRNEIADLMLSGKTRLGEKRADKFLEEFEKKATSLSISDFLGSLGFTGLGKRRVTLIQEALPGKLDKIEDWFTTTLLDNAAISTVPNTAERIHNEIMDNKNYIQKFLDNGLSIIKPEPKKEIKEGALLICITGKLNLGGKKHYQTLIEDKGNIFTDTFSKDLDYLVASDPAGDSSKLKKARKLGIKIITEDELLGIIK